jgi:hypothetical protein
VVLQQLFAGPTEDETARGYVSAFSEPTADMLLDVKVEESVLGEGGLPDLKKLKPILFAPENRAYHGIGGYLGKAFSIGREVKQG